MWDTEELPVVQRILSNSTRRRVLDAGCGTGRYAEICSALDNTYIGVDASGEMLKRARNKTVSTPNAITIASDMQNLPIQSKSTQNIICARSLSHVREIEPIFKEFARVTMSGSKCIITDIRDALPGETRLPTKDGLLYVSTYRHTKEDLALIASVYGFTMTHYVSTSISERLLREHQEKFTLIR